MMDKPIQVEVSMRDGSDEVMFTDVFQDGYRRYYWLPFWRACWHCWKLIFSGVTVKEPSNER
jgi:hypothetical protein